MNGSSNSSLEAESQTEIPKTMKLSITDEDVIRLEKYDKFLHKTINGVKFPLTFNTDGVPFNKNREVSYALRKLRKNIYNQKDIDSFEVEIERKPVVVTKWSQVAQQALLKDPKSKTPTTKVKPINQTSVNFIASNALQPLGIVSLKLMYDKSFTNLLQPSASKILPHGLINTGNICYMNSVLQMLLHCSPFTKLLDLVQLKTVASLDGTSRTSLLDATILFMNEFEKPGDQLLSPELFYKLLSVHPRFSHLKWGQQEDLEEFLGYLLDGLHEEFIESIKSLSTTEIESLVQSITDLELKSLIQNALDILVKTNGSSEVLEKDAEDDGWHEVGSNKKIAAKRTVEVKPSPITLLFGGLFRSVLEVPKQKESKSITLDPFQHIQLDISDIRVQTLEDLFELFSEPELIPYKLNNGNDVMARKQTFIDKLPNLLIIHLKRFSFVKEEDSPIYHIEKLHKKVIYSHELEIPLSSLSPETKKLVGVNDSINKYQLSAVVYHHGMSAEGGHYTCDVMKLENQWIRIDDGSILPVVPDTVLDIYDESKSAYILLFQRLLN